MASIREEFQYRVSALENADYEEITGRLIALLAWMESKAEIQPILASLKEVLRVCTPFEGADLQHPPRANTTEAIAAVGFDLIGACMAWKEPFYAVARKLGIQDRGSSRMPDTSDAAMRRYVHPFLNYVLRSLPPDPVIALAGGLAEPPSLAESLVGFRKDYPDPKRVCFVMMRFGKTTAHDEIVGAIKDTLTPFGITALRADDKEYHEDLFPNVLTYVFGCSFGIAVFERIESNEFNPNVALELGYMMGLRKPVLLLKDQTVQTLHADLVGKLYRPFDPLHPKDTIPKVLRDWLDDKNLA